MSRAHRINYISILTTQQRQFLNISFYFLMLQAASAVLFEHLHATQILGQILNLHLLNTFSYYFKGVYASKVFFSRILILFTTLQIMHVFCL